jgi:hypothetical protein
MTSLGGAPTRLEISLVGAAGPTDRPGCGFGFIAGGPEQLLGWLEQQLGLSGVDERWWRVELLARALDEAIVGDCYPSWGPLDAIEASYRIDRFAAASKLLHVRDSLLLECPLDGDLDLETWPFADYSQLPLLAAAASTASKAAQEHLSDGELFLLRRSVADRVKAVAAALEGGQILPRYEIVLVEPAKEWPRRWRDLFAKLHVPPAKRADPAHVQSVEEFSPIASPTAKPDTALAAWQSLVDPRGTETLPPASGSLAAKTADKTLAALTCSSMHAACTAVASALAVEFAERIKPADGSPGLYVEMTKSLAERRPMPWLDDVMIVCADDDTALCLDGELSRLGLPTFGASASRTTSDLLAILPLAIAARFTPAHADRVRELLCLAVPPVDVGLARELVGVLRSLPGAGSPKWDATIIAHPRVEDRVTLGQWIPRPAQDAVGRLANPSRGADGRETLSVAELRDALDLVETYALDRRVFDNQGGDPAAQAQLRIMAERARAIGRLIQPRASEDRLDRAEIDAHLEHVSESFLARVFAEQAGSPFRVRSLAAIRHSQDEAPINIRHVIWLGVRSDRVGGSDWSSAEIDQLHKAGLYVPKPTGKTLFARHAEQDGILRIAESLTVVDFPAADNSCHAHPLWTLLKDCLSPAGSASALVNLDAELAAANDKTTGVPVGRWTIPVVWTTPEPAPSPQPEWVIPSDIKKIQPRNHLSWTELDKRVGCPLAWLLERHAGFWPGRRADVPNDFILLGTVAEQIIREEAATWLTDPPTDEDAAAERMLTTAKRMLPFLWPVVAVGSGGHRRDQLYQSLDRMARAMQSLAGACDGFGTSLDALGPRVAMRGGHTFTGEIDWAPTSDLIVLDFKWGKSKYADLFANENFGQLAIYAWNRLHRENAATGRWTGKAVDEVFIAYWSIRDAALIGKPPSASTQSVADSLEAMLMLADDLFGTHTRAIAWPLLPPAERQLQETAGTPLHTDLGSWATHLPRQSGAASTPKDTWHLCDYCKFDRICGKTAVR